MTQTVLILWQLVTREVILTMQNDTVCTSVAAMQICMVTAFELFSSELVTLVGCFGIGVSERCTGHADCHCLYLSCSSYAELHSCFLTITPSKNLSFSAQILDRYSNWQTAALHSQAGSWLDDAAVSYRQYLCASEPTQRSWTKISDGLCEAFSKSDFAASSTELYWNMEETPLCECSSEGDLFVPHSWLLVTLTCSRSPLFTLLKEFAFRWWNKR